MKLIIGQKIKVSSTPVNQTGWRSCPCGLSIKGNKSCGFCGRGGSKPSGRHPVTVNRYELVDANEITKVPKGDHYMDRR